MTQTQILDALKTIISKSNGQNGHLILDSSYSGSDSFETIVILQPGSISYTDKISGNKPVNIAVENKDAFYGSMTNVTLLGGATAIAYYI